LYVPLAFISAYMKRQSPVFIVGPARSGTSILYRTLQKHPSFKVQHSNLGLDLAEAKVFISPKDLYIKGKDDQNPGYHYMLRNDHYYDRLLSKCIPIILWQRLIFQNGLDRFLIHKYDFSRKWLWKMPLNHLLLRAFFFYSQKARGCRRLVEKTPSHLYLVPEIMATFPRAKILFIYRHPIDTFSSYRRRLGVELKRKVAADESSQWLKISPSEFCTSYNREVGFMIDNLETLSDHLMAIRYEDFTLQPDRWFESICAFIGEPYDVKCFENEPKFGFVFEIDPFLFKRITAQTKDWSDYVNNAEARYIEGRLQEVMEKLGYQPYHAKS
jgi:hypothetical protein